MHHDPYADFDEQERENERAEDGLLPTDEIPF